VLQVTDPSKPNEEGVTALHNAVCGGHVAIVQFLIDCGCNVNAPDTDGW
jgi:apoptosis-stimulating of p53 protein 1